MEKNRLTTIFNTNSVEYKTIADLCSSLPKATLKQSELQKDGPYPVMNSGRTFYGTYSKSNNTGNAITIASRGEYAGFISYINQSFWAGGLCYPYRSKNESIALTKYIYYALKNSENKIMDALVTRGSIPALNKEDIEKFTIPVPPLPVQEEIVRILDMFTELEAELAQELAQELARRKQQYAFYRDRLLSFESPIVTKTIGEICEIRRGKVISKDYIREHSGMHPVYSSQTENDGVLGLIDSYDYDGEYLTWTTDGANAGTVFHRTGKFNITNVCGLLKPIDANVNARYLYYILGNIAGRYVEKGMGNPKLMSNVMEKIKVPIPPLDIQQRLVNVLDNFDVICSDLSIGLPAEMSARQKQYEYYRDLLLEYAANGLNYSRAQQSTAEHSRAQQSTAEHSRAETNSICVLSAEVRLIQYVFGAVCLRLGDIGKISMCKRIMKNETNTTGDVPFYKIGTFGGIADAYISKELFDKYKNQYSYPNDGDVLISAAGTIGRTVVFDGKPAYFQDSNIVWIDNDEELVLNRFLYYYYQTNPWAVAKGGTIPRLYNDNIAKTKIQIPQMEEQGRIVNILDRFDKLCNDIFEGLPAEIEKRHQQYEYYRDKLLSFR